MEKFPDKQTDFASSSSQTAVEFSESDKKKPEKKKKGPCSECRDLTYKKKKKERTFQGSEWMKAKLAWDSYIRKHRKDLRIIKHVVDDAPPFLNIPSIYDPDLLKYLAKALKHDFEANHEVVKRVYMLSILPGNTDTFTFDYKRTPPTNYEERKKIAKMIEKENRSFAKKLKKTTTKMVTVKEYAEEWKTHESIVENTSQFPLWWKIKKEKAAVEIPPPIHYFKQHITEKSAKYPDKRPRVVLEISIKNVGVVGKMVAMLYSDYVPMTVKNFLAFCNPKAPLTYKGNFFYFIFPNYYCQTGDVVENRGFGGTSIYGPYFGNEDSTLDHAERGVLTMYSKIPNRNQSQFLILFRKLESLNGQNVVFGKIVKGLHILDTIESVGSKKTGRPKVEIYISDCDEI